MKLSDGKLGKREFLSVVLFAIGIKFSDTTPDLFFSYGKNAAWMIPIISCLIVSMPLLVLLRLLSKHPGQGLIELLHTLMGKYVGAAVGLILFLIMFAATILNTRNYVDIVNSMYYPRTPLFYLLLTLIAVCYFVANRGFETLGRSAWLIFPYIQIIVIFLILFVIQEMNWAQLFPIAGPGLKQVFIKGTTHNSIFGEAILMTCFACFAKSYEDFRFSALVGFSFSGVQIAFFTALFVLVFDYPAVSHMVYPFHQLARTAAVGQMITNVEALFFGFWIISTVLHFSILLYLCAVMFARSVQLDEFEPLLLPLSGLAFLTGLLPDNIVVSTSFREILLQGSSLLLLTLPFVLWALDRWKGKLHNNEI
ncbi:endospore germination permease [Paenibacillus chondroitinus]|uniref:Endospore germination permease n=1 Tax=Paenibacillus chondroitinus TaxID=59842 RepID=A0ABU6DDB4_9BACL|nr:MULTISPECIES: endospore germination permease [Paenibacillus]MCY9659901.1 endospore germination permease [Paenibacillus anseongense]MEB4795481.1 endospore germination permease [Paenibacillus chondroitinus]